MARALSKVIAELTEFPNGFDTHRMLFVLSLLQSLVREAAEDTEVLRQD